MQKYIECVHHDRLMWAIVNNDPEDFKECVKNVFCYGKNNLNYKITNDAIIYELNGIWYAFKP